MTIFMKLQNSSSISCPKTITVLSVVFEILLTAPKLLCLFPGQGYGQSMGGEGKGFLNLKGNQEEYVHWLKQSLSCEKIKREQMK